MLIRTPRTPVVVRILSLIAALVIAAVIVRLVFAFGWYASGLAAYKDEERRRREGPISVVFDDPNRASPPAGGAAPQRP